MTVRRARVKICGITREEDARQAASLGADALGLVFYPHSGRYLEAERAAALARCVPPFVTTVGLFLDADPAFIEATVERVPLDLLQLHGDESPAYCRALPRPYIKAVAMADVGDARAYMARYPDARGFLLDSHATGQPGGSGRRFDWAAVPQAERAIVLAGGLTADNVGEAVRRARPWGVDVSSGVETAPGVKDAARMAAFIRAVTDASAAEPA